MTMRRISIWCGFALFAMMWFTPYVSYADETVDLTVTVGQIFYLEVHGGPLNWTGDYEPDSGDYDEEWTDPQTVQVRIWANAPWGLWVRGTAGSVFEVTSGGWETKPVGDIMWQDGDPTGWHPLTESNVWVKDGPIPSGDYYAVDVTFRVLLDWATDLPGTYTYGDPIAGDGVTFTASAQ